MRTHPAVLATLLALAPATAPQLVFAQSSDDAATTMARARFKEGVGFFDKHEYDRARASFLQAYALKKHPSVLLNLAWSCVKGTHPLEGERDFQQLLGDDGKELTDKQRADAADGLNQAQAKLGRIGVSAPSGTVVTLDGERAGAAPLDPIWVEPGAHTVEMRSAEGAQTVSVSVLAGEKALARYAKTVAAAVAPSPPSSLPPAEAPSPPAEAPPIAPAKPEGAPATTPGPTAAPAREAPSSGGLFSPPNNVVPAVILGGVAVAGFVGAGIALAVKQQAQNSANQVAQLIETHAGNRPVCANPTATYQAACSQLATDNSDVNQDATAGNVLLAVGIASTVGGLAYWMFADKKHVTATASVSPSFRGLVVSGEF